LIRGVPAISDTIPATPVRQAASGVALICGDAMTVSPLVEGRPLGGSEADIYAAVAAAILRYSRLEIVLHSRATPGEEGSGAAIVRAAELLPNTQGRLRVIAAQPLEALLPGVDLLVSFASPALIAGCRNGLKPVQIGRAVNGSAAFSHVFPDIAGFAAALAAGGVAGGLSVREYEQFDEFCRRVAGGGVRLLAAQRQAQDSIVTACRPPAATWRLASRLIASALANPFAVWRLLRAGFGTTAAR
jgi:hypothetical protein